MEKLEVLFLWSTIIIYAATTIFYWISLAFSQTHLAKLSRYLFLVGFLAHSITNLIRWLASGHFPVIDPYENALLGTWFVALIFFIISKLNPPLHLLGAGVLPFALIVLGIGIVIFSPYQPLTPTFKSIWLWIHVLFAWLAYGSLSIATAFAIFYLIKAGRDYPPSSFLAKKIPSIEKLDQLIFRYVIFGFLTLAVMIVTGAIWAANLWGKYWSWDPVETWSLLTWLVYGLYLHLRLMLGWKGKFTAWLVIIGLLGVLITFWGVQFFPTSYHLFLKLGRMRF